MSKPSRYTLAEGLFKRRYGARKAAMVLGRMTRAKAVLLAQRMRSANKT